MFKQEINLYSVFEGPVAEATLITWRQMWIANVICVIYFILLSFYSTWELERITVAKNKLTKQVDEAQQLFYKIKSTYPSVFFSRDVSQSLQKLSEDMRTREKILAKIANRGLFSDQLIAFSNAIIPNVWLTEIMISNGGDQINLKGNSLSNTEMQQFLTHLTTAKIFAHYALAVKNLEDNTVTDKRGDIFFELSLTRANT